MLASKRARVGVYEKLPTSLCSYLFGLETQFWLSYVVTFETLCVDQPLICSQEEVCAEFSSGCTWLCCVEGSLWGLLLAPAVVKLADTPSKDLTLTSGCLHGHLLVEPAVSAGPYLPRRRAWGTHHVDSM